MAVHIATCRFISKVFPSGRERSFLRPISRAHQHSHVHAHAPTCPCRYSLCSIFPSYRCEASSFYAVRWRLRFEPRSDSLYRGRAMRAPRSYCVTRASSAPRKSRRRPARTVPRQPFFCACDVFTFVILTGPVWFDVARARTSLGSSDIVIILWSLAVLPLVLWIVVVPILIFIFVENYGCDEVLRCSTVIFFWISTMKLLLIEVHYSWQGEIFVLFTFLFNIFLWWASCLITGAWCCVVWCPVHYEYDSRVPGSGRSRSGNLGPNERRARRLIRLSPSPRSLALRRG